MVVGKDALAISLWV